MFRNNVIWVNFKVAKLDYENRVLTLKERVERQSRRLLQSTPADLDVITPLRRPILVEKR